MIARRYNGKRKNGESETSKTRSQRAEEMLRHPKHLKKINWISADMGIVVQKMFELRNKMADSENIYKKKKLY